MEGNRVVTALASPHGSAQVAAGDVGGVLRTARRALRLTQAEVAARTGYSQPTVSRAEQGQVHDPTVLGDLADALQVPSSALGLGPDGTLGGPLGPTGSSLDSVERRDVLRGVLAVASAAMLPAGIAEPARNRRIGRSDVVQCQAALDRLYELDYIGGGRPVYELTASMARRLQDTLGRATYSPAVGKSLRAVAAATCENAGWQAYDAGRYDDAHRWWLETRHLASLGDGATEAHVIALASMSLEASERDGRARDAVGLAQTAVETAGATATPTLLSLLAAREAVGHAGVGDNKAMREAFGRAHQWLDKSDPAGDPTWLSFFGPSDLAWHEYHAAQLARHPTTAARAARTAIEHTDPVTMPRNHAIYSACHGHALAMSGHYDEAIEVSRTVLQNDVIHGSVRPISKLQATARILGRSSYPAGKAFGAAVTRLTVSA